MHILERSSPCVCVHVAMNLMTGQLARYHLNTLCQMLAPLTCLHSGSALISQHPRGRSRPTLDLLGHPYQRLAKPDPQFCRSSQVFQAAALNFPAPIAFVGKGEHECPPVQNLFAGVADAVCSINLTDHFPEFLVCHLQKLAFV